MDDVDFDKITRFEVIDETGRAYVRSDVLLGGAGIKIELSYQDDGKTLKVFVQKRKNTPPPILSDQ